MRLIDADVMLGQVGLEAIFIPCGKEATELALRQWIEKQPTAYDVEKVVEEIEELRVDDNYDCIDIVRKGGIDG